MKTISRRFRFVAFGVIVIVAVVSCCPFLPIVPNSALYSVEIRHTQREQYVNWKQPDFDKALIQLCDRGGTYCLKAKLDDGTIINRYHPKGYKDCTKDCTNYSLGNIRTVKVTKSKAADNIAAGESAVNDPNVMHKIQSPDPGDISAVLKTLKL
jgi:hypothetical protein